MANIKSSKKRIVQNSKRSELNKNRKSKIRSSIKKIDSASIDKKNKEELNKRFLKVESELAKAVNKGVYKKNTASRLISRLAKKIKSIN
jgi:small subunit ribosomal protein S20